MEKQQSITALERGFNENDASYAFKRNHLIVDFLASTTEQEQLNILAKNLPTSFAVMEALAHSRHESVLKAILNAGSEGDHLAATITIAYRSDITNEELTDEAGNIATSAIEKDVKAGVEEFNRYINKPGS